jgi:hypothetical protein
MQQQQAPRLSGDASGGFESCSKDVEANKCQERVLRIILDKQWSWLADRQPPRAIMLVRPPRRNVERTGAEIASAPAREPLVEPV